MSAYATFRVGDTRVGVPVEHVHEILVAPEVMRVPLARAGVLGLLNRRGEVVTVLDARTLLGLGQADEPSGVHVIVSLDGETVSLAVDAEGDVVTAAAEGSHPVPETVAPALRRALAAVVELDGEIVVVLRTDVVLTEAAA